MSKEYDSLISYINDNVRFGSKIKQELINQWFKSYSLKLEEKFLIYDELDSLKIEILNKSINQKHKQLSRLYTCLLNETEIKKSVLLSWFDKNAIDKNIQENFFEEFKNKDYINIIDDTYYQNFDFLDDLFDDEDLDTLLDDEDFINEVNSIEEVVDKSKNIDYLIQLKSVDETKSKEALDNLVEANKKLVWKAVRYYSGLRTNGFDTEDMYQMGMEGLMKAAEKFDVSLGNTFSTYAVHWIRQHITRGIADYSTLIRIPVHYRERMSKFIRVENELWNKLARPATKNELAQEMNIPIDEIEKLKFYIKQSNLTSLDMYLGADEDTNLLEFIAEDDSLTPEKIIVKLDKNAVIKQILEIRLTVREREIIYYRFGLIEGTERMTLEEIGQKFNVTRERIRQIEKKAIKKLRNHVTSEILKEYFYEY